ncbi:hypothetical protein ACFL6M_04485 [Candidatus Eisenbacteria bacterium]|uniref:PilZ domain-containing protein n=1 Tax=Eiseniibacteriota bacterium TaxID=2212470 RepID=A0ABV6YKH6_UNCEI
MPLIESIELRDLPHMLPGGTLVRLAGEGPAGWDIAGILSSWSGRSCLIDLPAHRRVSGLCKGGRVVVRASRLDGTYRFTGTADAFDPGRTQQPKARTCSLRVHLSTHAGSHKQSRDSFRLSGLWHAVVRADDISGGNREGSFHPALVRNLSSSGMMLEVADGVLSDGCTFLASVDLGDGGQPLRTRAQVVRLSTAGGRSERPAREATAGRVGPGCTGLAPLGPSCWGCRFLGLSREGGARVGRVLHEKLRTRFFRGSHV